MGLDYLQDLAHALALGSGAPAALRDGLLGALAELGLDLPGAAPMTDEELASLAPHSLLAFVDDSAAQAWLRVYDDRALPDAVQAALERADGLCAAGPADLADHQLAAVVRVLGLAGVAPDLDAWLRDADPAPDLPTADEMAALHQLAAVEQVVVNSDGSPWRHGPAPSPGLLRRRFSRVVSFELAM